MPGAVFLAGLTGNEETATIKACAEVVQRLLLRRHTGYDHSYWFIASSIDDHLRHHARALGVA